MSNSLIVKLPIVTLNNFSKLCGALVFRQLHGPPKVNEYSPVAVYPPIPKHGNETEKRKFMAQEQVKALKTVEEKQYQINRPKKYGWYSYIIDTDWIPADSLDFVQFATWTTRVEGLPDYYSNRSLEERSTRILEEIAPRVEQTLANELSYRQLGCTVPNDRIAQREKGAVFWNYGREDDLVEIKTRELVKKIHQIIFNHLAGSEEYLVESAEDNDSRNEAFWFRGGIHPDKAMLKKREGTRKSLEKQAEKYGSDKVTPWNDDQLNETYERALQIKSSPVIQLRSTTSLEPFIDWNSKLSKGHNVPIFIHDPRVLGFKTECQHGTNIPGHWPEDQRQFGLLSWQTRCNKYNRQTLASGKALSEEVLRSQELAKGILNNFGWTFAQACHLGFSPLNEITYPLSSQSISTDGRCFTYFAYQLNSCDLTTNRPELAEEQSRQNIIWCSPEETLYSKVEDGKVFNFNPDSLKTLIKMYLNKPKARGYNMSPYLRENGGTLVNVSDPYQRSFLMDTIRKQYSRRPPTHAKPEMYLWEKILQVDHNALPQLGTRRRRWFQMYKIDFLGKEHWHPEFVSTDETKNRYIPKGYREPWQRKKGLGRRYSRYAPKLEIPLKDKVATFTLPGGNCREEEN